MRGLVLRLHIHMIHNTYVVNGAQPQLEQPLARVLKHVPLKCTLLSRTNQPGGRRREVDLVPYIPALPDLSAVRIMFKIVEFEFAQDRNRLQLSPPKHSPEIVRRFLRRLPRAGIYQYHVAQYPPRPVCQ